MAILGDFLAIVLVVYVKRKGNDVKFKFVLVLLMYFGFTIGSYADSSKESAKTEVNDISDDNESRIESKWITRKRIDGDITWYRAKEICSNLGTRLPTIDELKEVVTDCGGKIVTNTFLQTDDNRNNSSYQDCYEKYGFSGNYWSSTTTLNNKLSADSAKYIEFEDGYISNYNKFQTLYLSVRCVREGFSSTEIAGFSNKYSKYKWVTPLEKARGSWSEAKKVCSNMGARLPTIDELKSVVIDCEGVITNHPMDKVSNANRVNSSYQACYKKYGFNSLGYWSSTTAESDTNRAYYVYYSGGSMDHLGKSTRRSIRCVKKRSSKTEIGGISNKNKSSNKYKWITTGEKGKRNKWSEAKKMCSNLNARLPTIDELKKVVTDCGGEIATRSSKKVAKKNRANSDYQDCYKIGGFTSSYYWSSTINESSPRKAWYLIFRKAIIKDGAKSVTINARCVRDE